MEENIHKGHRQRVREKFLKSGFSGFADHEKLELLLFYGISRQDTNPIAHELMKKFGSIAGVFDASIEQLMDIKGISESTAALIKLIPEMMKEYSFSSNSRAVLKDYKDVCSFFLNQYAGESMEKVKMAFLDDKLRLMSCEDLFEGSPDKVIIDSRKMVETVLKSKCTNVIIAHNHPNGDVFPSDDDIRSTGQISKLLRSLGIKLLDHIIVADGKAMSLKEAGDFSLL